MADMDAEEMLEEITVQIEEVRVRVECLVLGAWCLALGAWRLLLLAGGPEDPCGRYCFCSFGQIFRATSYGLVARAKETKAPWGCA